MPIYYLHEAKIVFISFELKYLTSNVVRYMKLKVLYFVQKFQDHQKNLKNTKTTLIGKFQIYYGYVHTLQTRWLMS